MTPIVSIIMGSTSDLPVMDKAAKLLDEMEIPFEINALSAHRTPAEVEQFAASAQERGIKVVIAAAGMAAALPGVIAANTTLPVIGVPIKGRARCSAFHCSNASRHPRSHSSGKRCNERRYPGCANARPYRQRRG